MSEISKNATLSLEDQLAKINATKTAKRRQGVTQDVTIEFSHNSFKGDNGFSTTVDLIGKGNKRFSVRIGSDVPKVFPKGAKYALWQAYLTDANDIGADGLPKIISELCPVGAVVVREKAAVEE